MVRRLAKRGTWRIGVARKVETKFKLSFCQLQGCRIYRFKAQLQIDHNLRKARILRHLQDNCSQMRRALFSPVHHSLLPQSLPQPSSPLRPAYLPYSSFRNTPNASNSESKSLSAVATLRGTRRKRVQTSMDSNQSDRASVYNGDPHKSPAGIPGAFTDVSPEAETFCSPVISARPIQQSDSFQKTPQLVRP